MDRRRFLQTSLAGVLAAPLVAEAQQRATSQLRIIGFSCITTCTNLPVILNPTDQAFVRRLSEAGYAIGKNVQVLGAAVTDVERVEAHAERLVKRQVSLIVAVGTVAALAARQATTSIPIVMLGAEDPIEEGLVTSLGRPGGNVTGLAIPSGQLAVKQIELLRQILPNVARVAILWSPNARQAERITRIASALSPLGVQVQRVELAKHGDTDKALAMITKTKPDALLPLEHVVSTLRRDLSLFALRARLPMFSSTAIGLPFSGELLRYGPSGVELFESAAVYVGKILNGATPNLLPVEEPRRFELMLNLPTARALGLTIPPSLLARADQVIE